VDALGLIGQLLDTILPGQHPPKPDLKKVDTGYRALEHVRPDDWLAY
jgi:hypothetical protein